MTQLECLSYIIPGEIKQDMTVVFGTPVGSKEGLLVST